MKKLVTMTAVALFSAPLVGFASDAKPEAKVEMKANANIKSEENSNHAAITTMKMLATLAQDDLKKAMAAGNMDKVEELSHAVRTMYQASRTIVAVHKLMGAHHAEGQNKSEDVLDALSALAAKLEVPLKEAGAKGDTIKMLELSKYILELRDAARTITVAHLLEQAKIKLESKASQKAAAKPDMKADAKK